MKAGFARVRITPPPGTRMLGFGGRDKERGCDGTHDDLFVRALFLSHGGQDVLVMAYDLCFLQREEADRTRGAVGRIMDMAPRQILINSSHTHAGPRVGTWGYADYEPLDVLYARELDAASLEAACAARAAARDVTIHAGATTTSVPVSRRLPGPDGKATWAPNPRGEMCPHLPVCLLEDAAGEAVCLLYSVSCHPSTVGGWTISADYPGVACRLLDEHVGATAAMFLQGTGGDTKACVIGDGPSWRQGSWDDIEKAGAMVAGKVIEAMARGLDEIEPALCAAEVQTLWPMARHIGRAGFEAAAADPKTYDLKLLWARRQLARLDRGEELPTAVPVTVHGVQIGRGLRMVGLEGEAVAGLGLQILDYYRDGVTFPLGYTDGAQLYLPTEAMLPEGGYEVDSYFEYGWPAPLVAGFERELGRALDELRARGIR